MPTATKEAGATESSHSQTRSFLTDRTMSVKVSQSVMSRPDYSREVALIGASWDAIYTVLPLNYRGAPGIHRSDGESDLSFLTAEGSTSFDSG